MLIIHGAGMKIMRTVIKLTATTTFKNMIPLLPDLLPIFPPNVTNKSLTLKDKPLITLATVLVDIFFFNRPYCDYNILKFDKSQNIRNDTV